MQTEEACRCNSLTLVLTATIYLIRRLFCFLSMDHSETSWLLNVIIHRDNDIASVLSSLKKNWLQKITKIGTMLLLLSQIHWN